MASIFYVRCERAWDGDEHGNEWRCGFSVHCGPDGGFDVYEDDGKGNGNLVAHVVGDSLETAKRIAIEEAAHLDSKGFSHSLKFKPKE